MARHRKPGRPKGSSNRKSNKEQASTFSSIDPYVRNQILAVVLFVLSFLILVSSLNFGGPFGGYMNQYLRLTFGWTVFVLPIILLGVGYSLFNPDEYEITPATIIGIILSVFAFSGIFHIFVSPLTAHQVAMLGDRGGLIGEYIQKLLLLIFNAPVSFVLLIALAVIGMLLATNTPIKNIKNVFNKDDEKNTDAKNDIKIHETVSAPKTSLADFKKNQLEKEKAEQPVATTVDTSGWKLPPLSLFEEMTTRADSGNVRENAATIQKTLSNFGIEVGMGDVNVGPTVTQYTLKPSEGVKLEKITGLDKNLALSLAAHPIRIEAPIPGKSLVGVEIPNKTAQIVRMRNILSSETFKNRKSKLSVVLGLDVAGHPQIADITKMPHLLVAGSTGSGKSVCINSLLMSLLYQNTPRELRLILVDPKRVELSLYNNIPHLLTPVIVDPDKTISALKWSVAEMERRYHVLQDAGKRNIEEFNTIKGKDGMPYIVIVIDELNDLMMASANEAEALICRIAQMARAVGIHLIVATQRPSVDVITGLIKANIPTRIAFSVAANADSRTILDQGGAEKLLGMGDMLFLSAELSKPKRVQGAYVSEEEVKMVTEFVKQQAEPEYNEEITLQNAKANRSGEIGDIDDELFYDAADCVIRAGKASASLLQRRLRVGYARAARLLDILEDRGVVGPQDGARPRDVLIDDMSELSDGEM
ncbi:MAG: DNA translocase FtsK 4TM domain-containing protein [bacterium]